jgi:hypothetical protein
MKWLLRAAGLVTIDLAAWLPTPCVEWSYYHTLLFATIFPVVYVAVAVLYKNFAQIRDYAEAACNCANYISERFRSLTNRWKVVPEPAPAPASASAPALAPGTSVPEAPAPKQNKALTESLLYKNFKRISDGTAKAACNCANYMCERFRSLTNRGKVAPEPASAPAPAPGTSVPEAPAPERNMVLTEALIRDVHSFFDWCFGRKNVVRALIMVHAPICSVLFEFFHFDGTEYNGFSTRGHKRELYLARDYTI